MPSSLHGTCRAVLDKGTLDAIASGGGGNDGDNDSSGSEAAAVAYMTNMWALLVENGIFVIISTMPPSIFNLLAQHVVEVPAIATAQLSSSSSRSSAAAEHRYAVRPLKTDAGGDVYYYVLTKGSDPSPKTITASLAPVLGSTHSIVASAADGSDATEEIQRLLREAQAAMSQLEEAKKKVLVSCYRVLCCVLCVQIQPACIHVCCLSRVTPSM